MPSSYLEEGAAFFEQVAREGRENPNPKRRTMCRNYLEHTALEFIGRWNDILIPERTVDHPIYKIRMGAPETVVYEGMEAVASYYSQVFGSRDMLVMVNSDTSFAVADWGISTFLTMNLFQTGAELREQSIEIDDPEAHYVLQTGLGFYWPYDDKALMIGENVYEVDPPKVVKVTEGELVTKEDIQNLVKPYLPHNIKQVGSSDAFL